MKNIYVILMINNFIMKTDEIDISNFDLVIWYSELNYYFTKYECDSIEELDKILWYDYGVSMIIL